MNYQNMIDKLDNPSGSFGQFIRKLGDDHARKNDYLVPTASMSIHTGDTSTAVNPVDSTLIMEGSGGVPTQAFKMNGHCFDQMAKHIGIETRTARRLRDHYGQEFDQLANRILRDDDSTRLVRTFDSVEPDGQGIARCIQSDRYKVFDHVNVIESVLPPLADSPVNWELKDGVMTDRKLYLRVMSRDIQAERPSPDGRRVGDVMALGMFLRNSETGDGSVAIGNIAWTLACLNGMERQNQKRFAHLGSAKSDGDVWSKLTQETKDADNKRLSLMLRDLARAYSSREAFDEILEEMTAAAGDQLDQDTDPQKAVEQLGTILKLTKAETGAVMSGLFSTMGQPGYAGEPVSRATLVNAVTAAAHKAQPDDVTTWQQRGDAVLTMAKNQWASIATAGPAMVAA